MKRKSRVPQGEAKWIALFLLVDLMALAVMPLAFV